MIRCKPFFLFFIIFSLLPSCKESSEDNSSKEDEKKAEVLLFAIRDWQISDVIDVYQSSGNQDKLIAEAEDQDILEKGFKLFIINDTLMSILEGPKLSHYTYTFDVKSMTFDLLELNKKTKKSIVVSDLEQGRRGKMMTIDYNGIASYKLTENGTPLVDDTEHPFYVSNNEWRIPAQSEESIIQLKSRLLNLVKHNAFILKTATKRSSRMVDFTYSNGLIRIYNGGIGVLDSDYLPRYWRTTFYNGKQAIFAYDIFRNYLKALRYHGAHGKGWVETDYNILIALYKFIDQDIKSHGA